MIKKYINALIFIIALLPYSLLSQRMQLVNYSVADGLPQSQIHCVIQDSRGYMWFGTGGGACRYNGVEFVTFDSRNGLPDLDLVFAMLEDSRKNIWFATLGGGICRFRYNVPSEQQLVQFNRQNGFPWENVFAIFEDSKGTIWFGTNNATVIKYNGADFEPIQLDSGSVENSIRAITEDKHGNLWFSIYGKGLCRLKNNKIKLYSHQDGLVNNFIFSIAVDSTNTLWLGSKSGLIRFQPNALSKEVWTNFTTQDGLPSSGVYDLLFDHDNTLWLTTDGGGVCSYNKGKFTVLGQGNGLINNRVFSIFEDREKNLWFGTVGGVSKLTNEKFISFSTEHGLIDNYITAIYQDRNGHFWFGTNGGGVSVYSEGKFVSITQEDGLIDNLVRAIWQDQRGNMWLGTRQGLAKYSHGTFTKYSVEEGLAGEYVRDIKQDHTGLVWIATNEGISYFDPLADSLQFTNFTMNDGLSNNSVWAILVDNEGVLWFGTNGGGVSRYKNDHFITLTKDDGLLNNQVFSAWQDRKGNCWFGTKEGVSRFDGKYFKNFTTNNGLSSRSIWAIVEDQQGALWFGGNNGIDKLDGTQWHNYNSKNGLIGNEINIHSAICDRNGNLWFGTVSGVTKYEPEKDMVLKEPPLVYIERIQTSKYNGRPVARLKFPHKENTISFDYIGLSFKDETSIKYQYYLEGFDENWNELTNLNHAKYTNLDDGYYTFSVRARNADGIWSMNEAKLKFQILPPFWERWWFIVLGTVMVTIIVAGIFQWRVARIKHLNRVLAEKVSERTLDVEKTRKLAEDANLAKSDFLANMSHEIRTPLNAIIGMTELTLETELASEQRGFLNVVQSSSEGLLSLINDILDFSKIEAGQMELESTDFNLREIVEGVAEIFSMRAEAKGIELLCYIEPEVAGWVVGDPTRLRQILVNLTGNAIKFTEQGDVAIKVLKSQNGVSEKTAQLHFLVKDTGIGISKDNLQKIFEKFSQADSSTTRKFGGTGLGLNISKSLIELMGGEMWAESQQGHGSTFQFKLNLPIGEGCTDCFDYAYSDCSKTTILVVDDNETNRFILRKTLTAWGFQVKEAQSGQQALSILNGTPTQIKLVILDQLMPNMAGPELALNIKKSQNLQDIKIIMLSSVGNFNSELKKKLNIDKYINKPVKQSKLLDIIMEVLQYQKPKDINSVKGVKSEQNKVTQIPRRILLVEDNPDNQKLAKMILEKAGYEVDLAENGQLAVEAVHNFCYDLILMDVFMPIMDGFDATKQIRALERSIKENRTPIIALTAHAIEGYREKCLRHDMDDFITKPVKKKYLLSMINKWLDTRPMILVVDDSRDNLNLIRNYLIKEGGFRFIFARNGKEAVDVFSKRTISLILMDMEMPVMDGYEASTTIRKLENGKEVPIIALTAHTGSKELNKCLEAGCTAYLSKPIRKQKLIDMISHYLGVPQTGSKNTSQNVLQITNMAELAE